MTDIDFPAVLNDSSRSLMEYASSVIGQDPVLFRRVMDLAWAQEYPVGMRAARVADLSCERHPELIRPYLPGLVRNISTVKDGSVRRIFLHILVRHSWIDDEEGMGRLVDTLFRWILDPGQPIAVRAYSMQILGNVAREVPDLRSELTAVLDEAVLMYESPGLKVIARKLLKRLRK